MANSRSLQQAVRMALAIATATAAAPTLYAQTAPAQAEETTPAPMAEVVVTGSRLRTPNETSISPITTVSAADVQATGLTRVEDILNNLPMVFAGMNSTTSNGADGTAVVDLRGLGNQRTLVLVDGRRLGPGTADGRNYSDINQIPAALIERVDIETGGASAVYGADAVAGVVNFILNTHFEGVKIDAGYHFNEHHNDNPDGVQQAVSSAGDLLPPSTVDTAFGKNASIIMGSNFADNRGNATAYITYDNQGAALQKSFDYSACSLAIGGPHSLACGGSYTSHGGAFLAYNSTFSKNLLFNTVDQKTGAFRPFNTATDLFNYGPYNYYQTPNERWTGGVFLNYDINSHTTAYTQFMYMRNSSAAQIAPSGDFEASGTIIPCLTNTGGQADPLLTASEQAQVCAPALRAAQGNLTQNVGGNTYQAMSLYLLRRNVEGGPRIADFQSSAARAIVGVKGDFGDGTWTYDVYAQHSTVDISNGNQNYLDNTLINNALDVITGPATTPNGAINPLAGKPECLSVYNGSDTKCVPWNVWVPGGVTPAAVQYMSVPLLIEGGVTEQVVSGSITGDLGKYGMKTPFADQGLQVNVGAEWRSEASQFLPDFLSQAGTAAGSGGPTPPIAGDFHVSEMFTELRLPLMSHMTGAEDLSIEGGYRYSSYTEGFNTNTYKLGLEWAPVRDVRFRASYQRAVRAPNIGELYTPTTVGLDGSTDQCAAPLAAGSPAAPNPAAKLTNGYTFAQCAQSGVTAGEFGHITPNSANQYNGLLGGNPTLTPEIADSYSAGFVLTPTMLPNVTFSIDYFDIKIKNVIGAIGGDTILSDCLNHDIFCGDVHRGPAGSLWQFNTGYIVDTNVNEGELSTKGFDVKANYRQPLPALGSLMFQLEGTKLNSLDTTPVAGGGSYDCVGYFGTTCGGNNPSWRSVLNITWSTPWDGLDLLVRWRYQGSSSSEQTSGNPFLTGTNFYAPLSNIPSYNYFDLTGTFNLAKNIRLELGVNNVFDKDPPIVVAGDCSTGSPAGANCNGNTFPGFYDAMGRYLFAHITAQF
jgi:iron complex outermembrane receptor protein